MDEENRYDSLLLLNELGDLYSKLHIFGAKIIPH